MRAAPVRYKQRGTIQRRLSARWRLVWDLGIATGWRISDMLTLRPDDLQGVSASIIAHKTGKRDTRELSPALMARLRASAGQWWVFPSPVDDLHPVTRQAAYKALRDASRGAHSRRVSPHSLRKTHAVDLYTASGDIMRVQADLQHDNLATTALYILSDPPRGNRQNATKS